MEIEERLRQLGLKLPEPAAPAGNYLPCVRVGELLFVSGQIPRLQGEIAYRGRVGDELNAKDGYEAAKICALNSLAVAKQELGSLDRIRRVVKVAGFVRSAEGFSQQPQVIDGASDLFGQLLGQAGSHARVAVGVNELPLGAAVELEVTLAVAEEKEQTFP